MSFLQPSMLWAVPLIALPIVIHLINQRRYQTVQWAAMIFLLAANQMSRGYARLRQWLILAARTLAVAGLIFAISRPLTSGWLGVAVGSRVDTTVIVLDRSPSMMQVGIGGRSKLDAGIDQLVQSLSLVESNRYVLIDSVREKAIEIDSPEMLKDLPETLATSESADVPTMLESAHQYIEANRPSRCEIWICSDVRKHDWQDDSGRWSAIRSSFVELPQMIRFHLLAYAENESNNRSIRVNDVRRVETTDGAQLLLSFKIQQTMAEEGSVELPIQLDLGGARSEFVVEMSGGEVEISNHVIPLSGGQKQGWGRISIPSDANPSDDEYYFVFDESVKRRTLVVADDPEATRPLEFAAAIPPRADVTCEAQVVNPDDLIGIDWETISLVLWQGELPDEAAGDTIAGQLTDFLTRGGQVIFFPPPASSGRTFAGLTWEQWQTSQQRIQVSTWVGDQDLLANTRSGEALPVGEMTVNRYCELIGDKMSLATLDGGAPLLARAVNDQQNIYFCTTTVLPTDSSLASSGVVLYAMIQRVLEAGAQALGNTRELVAGEMPVGGVDAWQQLAGNQDALSNEFASYAGVYRDTQQQKLFALNRSQAEDDFSVVDSQRVESLFEGLDFDRIDDTVGSGTSLIQEIWRLFLLLMMVALVVEAVLCIPRRVVATPDGLFPSAEAA